MTTLNRFCFRRGFFVLVFSLTLGVPLLISVPCMAQGQLAQGLIPDQIPRNNYLMPAFEKMLPKGKNQFTLINPSHFEVVVQVRIGSSAAQFLMKGKGQQKLYLPDGEYTVFFRFLNDKRIREGLSFVALGGEIFSEDGKKLKNDRTITDKTH